MEIVVRPVDSVHSYELNPRDNDAVAASIAWAERKRLRSSRPVGIAARIRATIDFVIRSGPAIVPVGALLVGIGAALFYLYYRRRPDSNGRRRKTPLLPDFDPAAKARPLGKFVTALSDLLEAVADERQPGETVAAWIWRAERVWRAAPALPQDERAFSAGPLSRMSLRSPHDRRKPRLRLRSRLIEAREAWLRRTAATG